jgi:formylglycine-generating enzyme required for sulfatase activity
MRFAFLIFLAAAALIGGAPIGGVKADTFRECPDCPEMVGIPAGKFLMGSPAHEPGRFDSEGPQHVVTLKAFALGKFDVNSAEFLDFLRASRYQPAPCNPILGLSWKVEGRDLAYPPSQDEPPRWPAVCLSWKDAGAYIAWLNGQVKAAHPALANRDLKSSGGPYRLPSEAEWEYAARAGSYSARWWGDDVGKANANCNGCGSEWDNHVLAPVDAFSPNAFGLYGMLGNAWQWTADCWHESYVGAPLDGAAWPEPNCAKHVLRGGAWNNVPIFIRSASRNGAGTDTSDYDYSSLSGFRVARDLP